MNEKTWHMPIFDDHKDDILGTVSDLRNMGDDRKGHSSRAAAFMMHFVGEGVKWIHIDLAGPTYLESAKPPMPQFCTGFGTQSILNLLKRHSQ
jgi:leucyl aminopeptidase